MKYMKYNKLMRRAYIHVNIPHRWVKSLDKDKYSHIFWVRGMLRNFYIQANNNFAWI